MSTTINGAAYEAAWPARTPECLVCDGNDHRTDECPYGDGTEPETTWDANVAPPAPAVTPRAIFAPCQVCRGAHHASVCPELDERTDEERLHDHLADLSDAKRKGEW